MKIYNTDLKQKKKQKKPPSAHKINYRIFLSV